MISFLVKFPARAIGKLLKPVTRSYSDHVHPGYRNIKKLQEKFQHDDCLPVHLKRGLIDRLLCMMTIGMAGICLLMDLKLYYDLINPPKVHHKPEDDENTQESKKEHNSKKEHGSQKEHESDKKGKIDDHKSKQQDKKKGEKEKQQGK